MFLVRTLHQFKPFEKAEILRNWGGAVGLWNSVMDRGRQLMKRMIEIHAFRQPPLDWSSHLDVGTQSKSSVVVPQHTEYCFYTHHVQEGGAKLFWSILSVLAPGETCGPRCPGDTRSLVDWRTHRKVNKLSFLLSWNSYHIFLLAHSISLSAPSYFVQQIILFLMRSV